MLLNNIFNSHNALWSRNYCSHLMAEEIQSIGYISCLHPRSCSYQKRDLNTGLSESLGPVSVLLGPQWYCLHPEETLNYLHNVMKKHPPCCLLNLVNFVNEEKMSVCQRSHGASFLCTFIEETSRFLSPDFQPSLWKERVVYLKSVPCSDSLKENVKRSVTHKAQAAG